MEVDGVLNESMEDLHSDEFKKLEAIAKNPDFTLAFYPKLEEQFQNHYTKKFAEHIRYTVVAGGFLFFLSYLIDLYFLPDHRDTLLLRFGLIGPVILALMVIVHTDLFEKHRQMLAFLSATTLSIGLMLITYQMPDNLRLLYINGMILVLIYAFCFTRIQFISALRFAGINFICLNLLLLVQGDISIRGILAHNAMFIFSCFLLLVNNFIMETSERQEFLQERMIDIEKAHIKKLNQHLRNLATKDAMTGISNFRHFQHAFANEWRRANRYEYPISLILMDFDKFKALNDTYGHQQGDESLKKIAAVINSFGRRPGDLAVRYGGDEFLLMLVDAGETDALNIAEKIRQAVVDLNLPNKNSSVQPIVTLTIGVATSCADDDENGEQLLSRADKALFIAKENGRNCVAGQSGLLHENQRSA